MIPLPLVRILENQMQALSRTFRHRFKDFQGPCLFSRTFQALKIWKNYSRTFKDPQEPCMICCFTKLHTEQSLTSVPGQYLRSILTTATVQSQTLRSLVRPVITWCRVRISPAIPSCIVPGLTTARLLGRSADCHCSALTQTKPNSLLYKETVPTFGS